MMFRLLSCTKVGSPRYIAPGKLDGGFDTGLALGPGYGGARKLIKLCIALVFIVRMGRLLMQHKRFQCNIWLLFLGDSATSHVLSTLSSPEAEAEGFSTFHPSFAQSSLQG